MTRPADQPGVDPVRARRAQVARWTRLANRLGYLVFGLACVLFVIALVVGFSGPLAAGIVAGLIFGSVLLAPSIILNYAVRAAEKEDQARGV
jgi:preprotein translocase subunit SecF